MGGVLFFMANNKVTQKFLPTSERTKNWRIFLVVLFLVIIGGMINVGSYYNKATDWLSGKTNQMIVLPHTKEIAFRLGLDLQGGTHLVYQANVSAVDDKDKVSAVEGARDVIERRVNSFGVSEPVVQTNKSGGNYQIMVELAGVSNVADAIKMIGETPLLEFKEQNTEEKPVSTDEQKMIDDSFKAAEKKATDVLGKAISGGNFFELAKEFSDDQDTKSNGGDLGWINQSNQPEAYQEAKKLTVGKVSELIKTSQGYQIYKLEEKRTKTNPFNNQADKEVKAAHILICYTGIEGCQSNLTKDQAYEKIKTLKQQATIKNFAQLAKDNSTEPGAKNSGGELGWFSSGAMVKPFEDAVFPQAKGTISYVVETKFGYHIIYKEDERTSEEYKVSRILINAGVSTTTQAGETDWKNTELTGKNLKRAVVQFDPNTGAPQVSLEFDEQGAKLFEDVTARNISKQVAIFLDGYAISSPTVNEKISGGKAVITGSFNIKEAKLLAQRLNTGALPVPITLVNQQLVGPSLGQKSVSASLTAGLIGFLLVAIFMILYYRLPGLLAVCALIFYSIFVLAIFKILSVTMTLSGIAGFILSIGMAVDANVLIFERLKEELKKGKQLGSAIDEGFRRAWPSIRDSNSASLITCFWLYFFYSGTIQGFAITLALGIIVSLFTAITVTRIFLKLADLKSLENKTWLFGVKNNDINN